MKIKDIVYESPLLDSERSDLMLTPYSHNPRPCIDYTHPKHEK